MEGTSVSKIIALTATAVAGTLGGLLYMNSKHKSQNESDKASESKNENNDSQNKRLELVVVGSANVDIYIDVKDIPRKGETVDGSVSTVGPGGKGSNQAAAAAKALIATSKNVGFIGNLGTDAHAQMFLNAYKELGVDSRHVTQLRNEPTGQAFIMLDSRSDNSIIIALGANDVWKGDPSSFTSAEFEQLAANLDEVPIALIDRSPFNRAQLRTIKDATIIMLQREIPDEVNLFIAKFVDTVRRTLPGVKKLTMLDMGGRATPFPSDILPYLSTLSLNETELSRLTGADVDITPRSSVAVNESLSEGESRLVQTEESLGIPYSTLKIVRACANLVGEGTRTVLVTLGQDGALLVGRKGDSLVSACSDSQNQDEITVLAYSPCFPAVPRLVDTTGAGDCFRGNFAAALLRGFGDTESLRFAAAASAICVGIKGTLPSMPSRSTTETILSSNN